MPDYGLTETGFVPKPLDVIIAEREAAFKGIYGVGIDLTPTSPFAQEIGIAAEREHLLWQILQIVHDGLDPDNAAGILLDMLAGITNTLRKVASYSTVTTVVTGSDAATVPAGIVSGAITSGALRLATTSTGLAFVANAVATAATLVAASAWNDALTGVIVGQRCKNNGRVYQATAITTGTVDPDGDGPTTQEEEITDGGVTWTYLGDGSAAVDVPSRAVNTGIVVALARDLSTIQTPQFGISGVINLTDAVVGAEREKDPALRVRRISELASDGNSPEDSIKAAIDAVAGVISARVFVNDGDTPDADGVPAHSFEALVRGGADADIFAAIYSKKAGGIRPYGSTSGTVLNSQGTARTIAFSRPTEVRTYAAFVLEVSADFAPGLQSDPTSGLGQVAAAVADYVNALGTQKDVVAAKLGGKALQVAGVENLTSVFVGLAAHPASGARIDIGSRQLATLDTSDIDIVTTAWVP